MYGPRKNQNKFTVFSVLNIRSEAFDMQWQTVRFPTYIRIQTFALEFLKVSDSVNIGAITFPQNFSEINYFLLQKYDKSLLLIVLLSSWVGRKPVILVIVVNSLIIKDIPEGQSWIPNFSHCDIWGVTLEIFH